MDSSLTYSHFRLRKFTFGNNGVEFTHDVLIKYQTMTCGFNIHLFGIQNKPSFLSGQTPAYSSWLVFFVIKRNKPLSYISCVPSIIPKYAN